MEGGECFCFSPLLRGVKETEFENIVLHFFFPSVIWGSDDTWWAERGE